MHKEKKLPPYLGEELGIDLQAVLNNVKNRKANFGVIPTYMRDQTFDSSQWDVVDDPLYTDVRNWTMPAEGKIPFYDIREMDDPNLTGLDEILPRRRISSIGRRL